MTEEQALKELLNLSVKQGWHNDTIHELIMTIAGRRKTLNWDYLDTDKINRDIERNKNIKAAYFI